MYFVVPIYKYTSNFIPEMFTVNWCSNNKIIPSNNNATIRQQLALISSTYPSPLRSATATE